MISGQSYLNKDIQLQVITKISPTNSNPIRAEHEKKIAGIKQDYLCHHTNRNLIKRIENTEHLPQISVQNSKSITVCKKFQNVMCAKPYCNLKSVKWPLIFVIICTCVGLAVYTSSKGVMIKQVLPIGNCSASKSSTEVTKESTLNKSSLEKSIDSEVHIVDADITDTILKGSTTLLRPVTLPPIPQFDFIKEIQFNDNIKSGSSDKTMVELKREFLGERDNKEFKYDVLSLLGFTSGHQNNFGVPIEEDERIWKLMKLDQHTEPSIIVSQTESSLIVSPTIPMVLDKSLETSTISGLLEETQCQSTSLYICREVLQYDLTVATDKNLSFSPLELNAFERLFSSNCSSRVAEFVCSILEPECRPTQTNILQPCKRFCKSIFEACSALVIPSGILTYIFDCDKYPDSNDNTICEDPTRRGICNENEFKCYDLTCIPSKWMCDNIKDCTEGDDETNCLICNANEFQCISNDKCLPDRYRCDQKEDCSDGSDEWDCDTEFENEHMPQIPKLVSFLSSLQPNHTNRGFYNTISDDDRLPAESELKESVMSASTTTISNKETYYESTENDATGNKNKSDYSTFPTSCINDQLRCVSGKCITVNQLCDRVLDCPEGEDEMNCSYDENQPLP